jgi:hypothetical protein
MKEGREDNFVFYDVNLPNAGALARTEVLGSQTGFSRGETVLAESFAFGSCHTHSLDPGAICPQTAQPTTSTDSSAGR